MSHSDLRADAARLTHVLGDVAFPAAKWQLIMHAEDRGADAPTRADLWRLPAGEYAEVAEVLAALGLATDQARPLPGFRPQPAAQAATRDQPEP